MLKLELRDLEKLGIIRKLNSDWASPVHMVGKKDGEYRVVGDFRELNRLTKFDQFFGFFIIKSYFRIPLKKPCDWH